MAPQTVLFLCTGNSCRSQMAEAWGRMLWESRYSFFSAGTHKHGMNPYALKVMSEAGCPMTNHFSKTVDELPLHHFDFVVTVCDHAHQTCPYFPATKIIHCGFEDPPKLSIGLEDEKQILDIYRRVRDQIKTSIQQLPSILGE